MSGVPLGFGIETVGTRAHAEEASCHKRIDLALDAAGRQRLKNLGARGLGRSDRKFPSDCVDRFGIRTEAVLIFQYRGPRAARDVHQARGARCNFLQTAIKSVIEPLHDRSDGIARLAHGDKNFPIHKVFITNPIYFSSDIS